MAESLLDRALKHTLNVEGGFVDHLEDPGGATRYGITRETLSDWLGLQASTHDVATLQWSTASDIYKARYWTMIRADELPDALAVLTFDAAVNSGVHIAVRTLQRALNHRGAGLIEDGLIGPATLRAAKEATHSKHALMAVMDEFVVKRGMFYAALDTFDIFGLGWIRRLVSTARLAHEIADETFRGNNRACPDNCAEPGICREA